MFAPSRTHKDTDPLKALASNFRHIRAAQWIGHSSKLEVDPLASERGPQRAYQSQGMTDLLLTSRLR